MKYILSIGTNIGERAANIKNAIAALELLPKTEVLKVTSLYETEPVGYAKQQDFYNVAVLIESEFTPHEMLGACLGIEAGFGRVREFKNGPRIIDIDLIFAQDEVINEKNLVLPHPRYKERRFVLEPILELFPDGNVFGTDIKPFINRLEGQQINRIEDFVY